MLLLSNTYGDPYMLKTILSRIGLLVVGVAFLAPVKAEAVKLKPFPAFSKLPTKEIATLKKSKPTTSSYKITVGKKKADVFVARIIINKPPAQTYKILMDFKSRYKYMPRMRLSKVLKKVSKKRFFEHQMVKVAWSKIHVHLDIRVNGKDEMTWTLRKNMKNGIKDNVGVWNMASYNGGKSTLLNYAVYTDPGRWVPGWLRRRLTKSSLRKLMVNVKKRVESGGTWKK